MFNYDQVTGQVRVLLPIVTGWFVTQHIDLPWWGSALLLGGLTIGCCAWDWFNNRTGLSK
jgi:hypothetical protein